MNVLVPPRMESLFLDHREGLGVSSPLPHALLVRDWPLAVGQSRISRGG